MAEFKFKHGDLVVLRASLQECKFGMAIGEFHFPRVGMVIHREWNDCPAGAIQHIYTVGMREGTFKSHEIEIVSVDDFDAVACKAACDEVNEKRVEQDVARYQERAKRREELRAAARAEAEKNKPQ